MHPDATTVQECVTVATEATSLAATVYMVEEEKRRKGSIAIETVVSRCSTKLGPRRLRPTEGEANEKQTIIT